MATVARVTPLIINVSAATVGLVATTQTASGGTPTDYDLSVYSVTAEAYGLGIVLQSTGYYFYIPWHRIYRYDPLVTV